MPCVLTGFQRLAAKKNQADKKALVPCYWSWCSVHVGNVLAVLQSAQFLWLREVDKNVNWHSRCAKRRLVHSFLRKADFGRIGQHVYDVAIKNFPCGRIPFWPGQNSHCLVHPYFQFPGWGARDFLMYELPGLSPSISSKLYVCRGRPLKAKETA